MIEYARRTDAEGLVLGTRTCHFLMTAYLRTNNVPQALSVLDKIEKGHYKVASGLVPLVRLSSDLSDALKEHFKVPTAVPPVDGDITSAADGVSPIVTGDASVLPLSSTGSYTDPLIDGSIDGHSDIMSDINSTSHIDASTGTHVDTHTNTLADKPTEVQTDVSIDTDIHTLTDTDTLDTTDPSVAEGSGPLSPLRSPSFNTALLQSPGRMIVPDIYFGADLKSFILLVTSNQLHIRPRIMGTPPHTVCPV